MTHLPRVREFNYACLRNADAARCYTRLLGVYGNIAVAMLRPSVRAFGAAHGLFLARHRLLVDSRATDDIRALGGRRERLFAGLAEAIAAGRSDADPAVKSAAGRVGRALRTCPASLAREPDTWTWAIAEALGRLSAPGMTPSLARLPACRDAVRSLAEANAAYARLYDECAASAEAGEASATLRLRMEVDDDARAMAVKVNSCADILGDRSLGDVAAAANAVLDETRHLIMLRGGHYEEPAGDGDGGEPGLIAALARPRVKNRRVRERSAVPADGGGDE